MRHSFSLISVFSSAFQVAQYDFVFCRNDFFDKDSPVKIYAQSSPLADGIERITFVPCDKIPISSKNLPVGYFLQVIPYAVGMCGSPWGRSRLQTVPFMGGFQKTTLCRDFTDTGFSQVAHREKHTLQDFLAAP